ncbi:hypothetical protein VNO78_04201 [Psophocarpus tetragonolobus]|uniref:Uncharacterized protein n=1 Tax=Psophocarpus tetragonolobus TaxID=3891 RepID=A0AAN9XWN7_PSOTE
MTSSSCRMVDFLWLDPAPEASFVIVRSVASFELTTAFALLTITSPITFTVTTPAAVAAPATNTTPATIMTPLCDLPLDRRLIEALNHGFFPALTPGFDVLLTPILSLPVVFFSMSFLT